MKFKICFYIIIFQIILSGTLLSQSESRYTIVIHGGAGYIPTDISSETKEAYLNSLDEALNIGKKILESGGTSLEAVEQVIRFFEDNSFFNAGKGAVFTSEGTHELDASIMNGKDLSCGAVAGVKIIKHPISLARLIMEKTPHVLFAGEGADKLGLKFGVDTVDNHYFDVESRYKQWKAKHKEDVKGTVGCVAIDQFGNIAAGTSTGGLTDKWHGRVGDSPLINAGTYANNKTCGVSCTGQGELFIRHTVAFNISALMDYKGLSLQEAADEVINSLPKDSGGVIAVDKDGNYVFAFNTTSMLRGVADSEGKFETEIWK